MADHLFRWESMKPTKEDFKNRARLICEQCDESVFQGSHGGRIKDTQYFYHYATEAAQKHLVEDHAEAKR
jgi:hypothetical protein